MRAPPIATVLLLLACAAPAAVGDARAQAGRDAVTIYRCVDARGKLTLRDTPCARGERQETRSMLRPRDAPPRAIAAREPAPAPVPRAPALAPPQPMYECTTPDGERYTSEDDSGRPRWVPLWTLGYPLLPPRAIGGGSVGVHVRNRHVDAHAGAHVPGGRWLPPAAYGAGTWIRDACQRLPPAEACARMRDRRDAIRRRFFNAMPSERDVLRVEERSLNARLDNDCGIS